MNKSLALSIIAVVLAALAFTVVALQALEYNMTSPDTYTPQPTPARTITPIPTLSPLPTPTVTPIMRSPPPTPVTSPQTNLSIAMGKLGNSFGNDEHYYIYGNLTTNRTAVIVGILKVSLSYCPVNTTDWLPFATNTLRIAQDSTGSINTYNFDVSALSGGTYNFKVTFDGDTVNNEPYSIFTYWASSAELDNVTIPSS